MKKELLRKLQLTQVEMLDEIVRICDAHSLNYFLIGGTLLGAARHQGFIPWDDDLDIVMPREDYIKFIKLCATELNDLYYLHSIEMDPEYWVSFIKIRKKNTIFEPLQDTKIDTPYKGVYIDIFPLDNATAERSLLQTIQAKVVKGLTSFQYRRRNATMITVTPLGIRILWPILSLFSIKTINTWINNIMSINKNEESSYFVNIGSFIDYRKQTMKKEWYFPPKQLMFEGKKYNVPNEWHKVLERLYGNYMELPPEEKRITHKPNRIEL